MGGNRIYESIAFSATRLGGIAVSVNSDSGEQSRSVRRLGYNMTESSSVQSITNQQSPKPSGRRAGILKLLVALTSAVLLAACGADVNTQLELDKNYSGERQFVLTMAESDADT